MNRRAFLLAALAVLLPRQRWSFELCGITFVCA